MGREADARQKLAAALANNPDLRDRFGRPIMEGGGYTVNFLQPPVYTAEKIAAALDRPDLPPGTFRVTLVSTVTLLLINGAPTDELALCAMPKAMREAAAAPPPGDQVPPSDGIQLTDAPDIPAPPAGDQPPPPALPEESPDVPQS